MKKCSQSRFHVYFTSLVKKWTKNVTSSSMWERYPGIPQSPADFQLHMHTPRCLPLFHFPVCWSEDMIVKQENRAGGRGVTVYLCTCTSAYKQKLCRLTHTPSWGTDSVSSVIPVMSIKLEWLTGRVWDGDGMGEKGRRPWEVSGQLSDNVDVITQELTRRDLMVKNQAHKKITQYNA